jgi:hypothetical protein
MMKHPELPREHCANQSPEQVMKVFVQSIAPNLKSGSINARRAISQLERWKKYHPEVFSDWESLCWEYVQQPPEWVDWLIQGVKATSEEVVEADELADAGKKIANLSCSLKKSGEPPAPGMKTPNPAGRRGKEQETHASPVPTFSQAGILRRIKRDHPDVAEQVERGEFPSARAAGIAAGFIKPSPPSLQLKEPLATAQKLLAKKGKEWCLALLDELSTLVFED